jgi:glyoxylase-like metal-dependent hydrolase (beta-lactamase superfamily II)
MRKIFIGFLLLITAEAMYAQRAVVKTITNDIITISPGRKQLHTLGWPNDIINSVAVKTSEGIVLIDTQNSPANARLIKKAVQDEFNDSTFVYIINTHGHSCHSGGNCVFDKNRIVAQANSLAEIKDYDDLFLGQTVDFLRQQIYYKNNILDTISIKGELSDSLNQAIDLYKFYEADLMENYKARYPDLTFEDSLQLEAGNKTIKLTYMGKGHGNADIVVYIKEDKVLCTGNLFHLGSYSEEGMPSFYINRPNEIEKWIDALNKILSPGNPIEEVITTHGKRTLKQRNLEFVNAYCKKVVEQVKKAKKENLPVETVQQMDNFEELFNEYSDVVSINKKSKEMHARNMEIIWQYIN